MNLTTSQLPRTIDAKAATQPTFRQSSPSDTGDHPGNLRVVLRLLAHERLNTEIPNPRHADMLRALHIMVKGA